MDVPGYALITGGASGIGRACAHGFISEGSAGVAILDLNLDNLALVKQELHDSAAKNGRECQIEALQVDVTNEAQVNEVIGEVAKTFGRLDYVVNAAGIGGKHPGGVAFAQTQSWRQQIDVNLTGTFFVLRAAASIMLAQDPIRSSINGRPLQRGAIVNFSSIQGLVGITLSAAYAASKHGIIGLTRSASEDYAKDGLRINAICPGYTETPLTTRDPLILKAMQERVATAVPMQRMASPEEIADGVLFLSGGRSSFVAGSSLVVDGGYTSR